MNTPVASRNTTIKKDLGELVNQAADGGKAQVVDGKLQMSGTADGLTAADADVVLKHLAHDYGYTLAELETCLPSIKNADHRRILTDAIAAERDSTKAKQRVVVMVGMTDNATNEVEKYGNYSIAAGNDVKEKADAGKPRVYLIHNDVKANGKATGLDGKSYNLNDVAQREAFVKSLKLAPDKERAVLDLIAITPPESRDEVAEMAITMVKAERGELYMDRMVFSGHSVGESVYGDRGAFEFNAFVALANTFPNAASQLENVFISGCYSDNIPLMNKLMDACPNLISVWAYDAKCPSGSEAGEHLKLWEEATRSGGVDPKSTLVADQANKKTQKKYPTLENAVVFSRKDPQDIEKAKQFRGVPLEATFERLSERRYKSFDDYYNGTKNVPTDHDAGARGYYRIVQQLLNFGFQTVPDKARPLATKDYPKTLYSPDDPTKALTLPKPHKMYMPENVSTPIMVEYEVTVDGKTQKQVGVIMEEDGKQVFYTRPQLERQRDVTIRLIYFHEIKKRLGTEKKTELAAGYAALGLKQPSFDKMTRAQAVAEGKRVEEAFDKQYPAGWKAANADEQKKYDAALEMKKLVADGLWKCDPTIIPQQWVS